MAIKTILLQGEHYVLGLDTTLSIGYNMKGDHVITKSVICIDDEDNFYCINGGIRIKVRQEDLKDFYHNTPANRKLLKKMIDDTIYS